MAEQQVSPPHLKEDDLVLWRISKRILTRDRCRELSLLLRTGNKPIDAKTTDDSWSDIAYNVLRLWCTTKSREATGKVLWDTLREIDCNDVADDFKVQLLGGKLRLLRARHG